MNTIYAYVLTTTIYFSLTGMELQRKQLCNLIPLQHTISNDVKREIINHANLNLKQWWYLDKIFEHSSYITSICFDPSGNLLATASSFINGQARIFDIQKHQEIASFNYGNYRFASVCFYPSKEYLEIASHSGKVQRFNIQKQQRVLSYELDDSDYLDYFSRPGRFIATVSLFGKVHIFDRQTYQKIDSFSPGSPPYSACCDVEGKLVATTSDDHKIRIFARYADYTLEQLLLKKALLTWLLIEKPNKKIDTPENLIKDVALKCTIPYKELITMWSTFPKNMQDAIWKTMSYKIQKYGKE